MKIQLNKLDPTEFRILESSFHGVKAFLVTPKSIKIKWTKKNLKYRSSMWTEQGEPISLGLPKFFNWAEGPNLRPAPSIMEAVNVVEKMYKLDATIGGEGSSSGVIVPPSRCRDGVLTLLFLIKIIADKKKKVEALIQELPKFYYIKNKITINPKKFDSLKSKIIKYYQKKGCKIKNLNSDSLKIYLNKDSFVWFRVSKTENNLLRFIADSREKDDSIDIISEALNLIKSIV